MPNIISHLECQKQCQQEQNCNFFNWNTAKNCYLRTHLPGGTKHFGKNPEAIVGPKNCSDPWIIWPDFDEKSREKYVPNTTSNTSDSTKNIHSSTNNDTTVNTHFNSSTTNAGRFDKCIHCHKGFL